MNIHEVKLGCFKKTLDCDISGESFIVLNCVDFVLMSSDFFYEVVQFVN